MRGRAIAYGFRRALGARAPSPRLRGEGGVRGTLRLQCICDRLQNPVNVPQYVIVPEAQDAYVTAREPTISRDVALIGGALTAIHFNNKVSFATNEVDDIRSDGFLPHELEPVDCTRSHTIPQLALSVGRLPAQPPGAVGLDDISPAHCLTSPSPHPLSRSRMFPTSTKQ